MNHIQSNQWIQYVKDELDESTRGQYESHLTSCDQCLALYLEAIEVCEHLLPQIDSESTFTDTIMQRIEPYQVQNPVSVPMIPAKRKKKLQQNSLINYVLAVAMTLILMSTGVFTQLMNVISTVENPDAGKSTSFVAEILNTSISITSKIENHVQEGQNNE